MSPSHEVQACELVDNMIANGAAFTFMPAQGSSPASFTYEQERGADRWRCRNAVMQARANPELWCALIVEIGRRCREFAHD